ncbi:unnamed protein product [Phaeothamnion confervicola]
MIRHPYVQHSGAPAPSSFSPLHADKLDNKAERNGRPPLPTHARNTARRHHRQPPQTVAIADDDEGIGRVKGSEHWVGVAGANWRHPEGPRSNVAHRRRYPAVHMTYNDAQAYCKWARRRLPTEAEWEAAARGGFRGQPYPWGDVADESALNTWQGDFPDHNTAQDGYAGLAPVDAYAPNPLGVWNSVGNVWEWVSGGTANKRIMKGGSYVDTLDGRFNHAATVATRMTITQDSGGHNVGFRCATGVGGGGEENGDGESGGGSGGAKKKKKAKKKRESPPSSADEL